jgi:predicted small secreted protein
MSYSKMLLLLVLVAAGLLAGCWPHHDNAAAAPPPLPTVTVTNNSSYDLTVTVNGVGKDIPQANTKTWSYSGSSFIISYPSGAGYDVPLTVTDGKSHQYTIYDDVANPGMVLMSGTAVN